MNRSIECKKCTCILNYAILFKGGSNFESFPDPQLHFLKRTILSTTSTLINDN